ncbi:receptor-type tyrosine-protein phosphatase F-like [Haliotis rufescens]|uniref:receptor-type tyrosine-protein phosphatase F-like n=1 Tax=Haliotis rufescens TaxID=6454 RepID=UPI00201ECCE0|nr:receptor-type tyrosine-protein phosphatase F-like [Haliotis rufescens]
MDLYLGWCFMLAAFSVESVLPTSTTELSTTEAATASTPDLVPGKVNNLKTTLTTSSSLGLSWTASTSDVPFTQYIVFTSKGGECLRAVYILCPPNDMIYAAATCNSLSAGTPATYDECHGDMSYNLTDLDSNTDYVVSVAAAAIFTVGETSTLKEKTNIGIPAPPTNIRGTAQNKSAILVEWDIPSHNAGPMWYNLVVLIELDRTSGGFIADRYYNVEGQNSSSCEVTDLLSSWRYSFAITVSTSAGTSNMATSKADVRTLPSTPGAVQNICLKFVHSVYLAVRLTWECPPERMRNGRIRSYTISYTGNISMTLTAGSYYPEDPCTDPHMVYLPVIPDGEYTVEVWANAEFQGIKSAMNFVADRDKMFYDLPSFSNTTVSTPDPHSLIVVSATCGSIIAILFVAVIALALTRSRAVSPQQRLYFVH